MKEQIKLIIIFICFTPLHALSRELSVGSSDPLTGGASISGKDFIYGINLAIGEFNQSEEKDFTIRLTSLNDKYRSPLARQNILQLMKVSPLFLGMYGQAGLLSALDFLEEKKIYSFFPANGMNLFRQSHFSTLIHLRASLEDELRSLAHYAVSSKQNRKIGIFYEESRWGEEGAETLVRLLKEKNIEPVFRASYPPNTINIRNATRIASSSLATAIVCISQIRPTYHFIYEMVNSGFQNCLFLGVSDLFPLRRLIKDSRGVCLVLSNVVPSPFSSKLPIVEEYREKMARVFPNFALSPLSLEGFIAGKLFIASLQSPRENELSYQDLISYFEYIGEGEIGGFPISFSPSTRSLSSKVWIAEDNVAEEWKES